jgi:hypothetical protein
MNFDKLNKLIILLCFISLLGCSTTPSLTQLNNLRPGSTKAELINEFGKPISTDFINGYYLLKYSLYDPNDIGHRYYYFVINENEELIGWQEYKGQNKIQIHGIIINLSP